MLKRFQVARTKDILSLEWGILKEKVTNDRNAAQCQALVIENKKLLRCSPEKGDDATRLMDCGPFLGVRTIRTLL
jgi:hypothetical protein